MLLGGGDPWLVENVCGDLNYAGSARVNDPLQVRLLFFLKLIPSKVLFS
jgi:hypothetical protein